MRKRLLCAVLAVAMLICILPQIRMTASAAQMDLSANGLALIKKFEGYANSGKPYWDYSQWSIGYGCYCPPDQVEYYKQNPLSEPEAAEMLRVQLQSYIQEVRDFLTKHKKTVTQNQFDALVSFTYNCGGGWTREETGYFHKAVESGLTNSELLYGMCLWSSAGNGDYILIKRRMCEANAYLNGVYSNDKYPENFKYVFLDGGGGTPRYKFNAYDSNEKVKPSEDFKYKPSGPDKTGAIVEYVFDGWYTARTGGTKVTALDGSLNNGAVLYARWKLPDGTPVEIPQEETGMRLELTVTGSQVNIRPGPGTYYEFLRKSEPNEKIVITLLGESQGALWGRFGDEWICLTYTDYESTAEGILPRWATVTANGVKIYKDGPNSGTVTATKNVGDQVRITAWKHKDNLMYGQTQDGWICLKNVQWNPGDHDSPVTKLELVSLPTKTKYVQKAEQLDLSGGVLRVTYKDGLIVTVPMSTGTVSGFDNSQVGTNKVTVTYAGMQVQFNVTVVKAVVTFKDYNGTVLSTGEYAYADAVKVPANPTRPADSKGHYQFVGWSPNVSATCKGSATYTAQYVLVGDVDGNNAVTEDDAIYLLYHVIFPEKYPLGDATDYSKDGVVNEDDAIYLLYHVIFPDRYPLVRP